MMLRIVQAEELNVADAARSGGGIGEMAIFTGAY
jgi:hypothetical protein